MKLTNTIVTKNIVVSDDTYTNIFTDTNEARISKILVSNLESSDISVNLYSENNETKTLIGTFLIPADSGNDPDISPVDILSQCELSSIDASQNSFLNTMADENIGFKIIDAETCELHITVKAELYD